MSDLQIKAENQPDTCLKLAKACGHCQTTINLLTNKLREYFPMAFEKQFGRDWSKTLKEILCAKKNKSQLKNLQLNLGLAQMDFTALIRIFKYTWETVFIKEAQPKALELADKCIRDRNKVSHQHLSSFDDCSRILLHLLEFTSAIPSLEAEVKEIERLIDSIEEIADTNDPEISCATVTSALSEEKKQLKATELKDKGNEMLKQGRTTEAIELYSRAITMDPSNATLFSNRSIACYKLGENEPQYYKLAREDAEDAVERDPTRSKSYHLLGRALEKLDLAHDAVQAYEDGFKANPRDTELVIALRDCRAKISKIARDSSGAEESGRDMFVSQMQQAGIKMSRAEIERNIQLWKDRIKPPPGSAFDYVMRAHTKRDVDKNPKAAAVLYEKAAKMGNAEALFNLGLLYRNGIGVIKDPGRALELLEKAAAMRPWHIDIGEVRAANLGVAEAQNALGVTYRDGIGVDVDLKRAVNWFQVAAKNDQVFAQNSLGYCFLEGEGVGQNYDMARQWFQKAADKDLASAQGNLATMYEQGLGMPINYELAEKWYQKAADQGHTYSIDCLARLKRIGVNKAPSLNAALEVLDKGAESGNPTVKCILAMKYRDGVDGIEKNPKKAEELLLAGAKQNHAEAQYLLGRLYADELHNQEAAFKWILQAAENGNTLAAVDVALFYSAGRGTPYNAEEACRWAKRAMKKTDQHSVKEKLKDIVESHSKNVGRAKLPEDFEKNKDDEAKGISWHKSSIHHIRQMAPPEIQQFLDFYETHREIDRPQPNKTEKEAVLETLVMAGTSKTAKRLFTAISQKMAAVAKAKNGEDEEAIKLLHQAHLMWHPLPHSSHILLKNTIERVLHKNPRHPEAMYCYALTTGENVQSTIEYLQNCITHHPLRAEFHEYLGSMLCWADHYYEATQVFTRCLKLDTSMAEVLYCRAVAQQRFLELKKEPSGICIILCDYQNFLAQAEPDAKKVAEAHYGIAEVFLQLGDYKRVKYHYALGREAECPPRRLPIFGPVDTTSKGLLDSIVPLLNKASLEQPTGLQYPVASSPGLMCFHCLAEKEGMQRCSSCKIAFYCNTKCQKANWSSHKIICKC